MPIREPTVAELEARGLTKAQYDALGIRPQEFFGNDPVALEAFGWPYGEGVTNYLEALSEDDKLAEIERRGSEAIRTIKRRQDTIVSEGQAFQKTTNDRFIEANTRLNQLETAVVDLRQRVRDLENAQ